MGAYNVSRFHFTPEITGFVMQGHPLKCIRMLQIPKKLRIQNFFSIYNISVKSGTLSEAVQAHGYLFSELLILRITFCMDIRC